MEHRPIIIFDGVCNLCESSVIFLIQRDKSGKFKFASAQSEAGINLQNRYGINPLVPETMVLIKNGVVYTKSDAAIEIVKNLNGVWKILSAAKLVPKSLRDWAYSKIAKNRYEWFGKKDSCMIPSLDIRNRFL